MDRVILVGDIRQHQAIEAGRPFEQLQDAGMSTAKLDQIVRQRDPRAEEQPLNTLPAEMFRRGLEPCEPGTHPGNR